jgi:DNA polymerase III subunit delta'
MNAPQAPAPLAPWQRRLYEQLVASLDSGTLGHALLFCGEPRLGKRALAELLAQRVLCTGHRGQPDPCGECRGCRLYRARSQREPLEQRPGGSLAHPDGHPAHPDAVFVGYAWSDKSPPRQLTQVTVDQVRALSDRLGRTPQYGDALVALVEPADALNESAANALLKTLEEPVPGRYLWLVTSHPSRLPATIRSRCQRLEMRMPPADEALAWLAARRHPAREASEALAAARGHPGLADDWLREGGLAVRREVARDLDALQRGAEDPVAVALRWMAGDGAGPRLFHAADIARDHAAESLTDPTRGRRLASWFDAANRARELLRTTVRADLVLVEVLLGWRNAAAGGGDRG